MKPLALYRKQKNKMIKKIIGCFKNGESSSKSILNAAFLVASLGLASRFLGLIRDRILASKIWRGRYTRYLLCGFQDS